MLTLDPSHVSMHQVANDKAEALQLLADILVKDGLTTPAYLQGLQDREAQHATYLGEGIAIPHGTPASRDAIIQTGVRLAHFPQGVTWDDDGNKAYLVVVISAKSDEHLQVLQMLTKALSSGNDVENRLKNATTAEEILAILNGTPDQTAKQLNLHENLIETDLRTSDIDEVLFTAGKLLKQQNLVENGFSSNLSLDNAIKLNDNIWCVVTDKNTLEPAVSLIRLDQAIDFNIKKQPHSLNTLVCIADHATMDNVQLSNLLDILLQPNALPSSFDRHELAQVIGATVIPNWQTQSVILANAHGLHARPATELVKLCQKFDGDVLVKTEQSDFVSAKSLTKLLSLGAVYGQNLTFIAEPNTDAEAGLSQVIETVKNGLGEDVQPINQDLVKESSNHNTPKVVTFDTFAEPITHLNDDQGYKAIIASNGLAVAKVHIIKPQVFDFAEFGNDKQTEKTKLLNAINAVKTELKDFIAKSDKDNIKQIFTAHLTILDDPDLLSEVNKGLDKKLSAPMAWSRHIEATAKAQEQVNNQLLAERAADLRDIGNKVLAKLCGVSERHAPNEPYILVTHDIVPSDVAKLDKNQVAGFVTAVGGASSHSAIVARALGIPALVGAGDAILTIDNNSQMLVDATTGYFYVNPNPSLVEKTLSEQAVMAEKQAIAQQHCQEPAITTDNHRVEVAVNIGNVHDTAKAVELGAEAVGLLRTELVFMSHTTAPDEATQMQDYGVVLNALDGRPLVVRTLDVGGDKPLPYLPMPAEENPFLGVRGIRLTLRRQELLREQLTALIKSAKGRPLRIMFPMIGRLEDWRQAKAILDDVLKTNPCDNLQVGIMVEVPSIAILAPILAKEVDFFSIGTNDLTQYTMAIDRGHPLLSSEADGLHPSVLMLINRTVHSAHAHGKWVGVCGELASDVKAVPILLGLGVDELSVSAKAIPMLKTQIRGLNFEACKKVADKAMNCATAEQVRALI